VRHLRRWQERDDSHPDLGRLHEAWHWLHEPAEWGRREKHEIRWPLFHHIHLIPIGLLARMCRRAERKK
jgi:hypothetical protein